MPISAFTNPQALDDNNKITLSNEDVVKNVIVRTMSGVLTIPDVQKANKIFHENFDKNANLITDKERENLEAQLANAKKSNNQKEIDKFSKKINDYRSNLNNEINAAKEVYNDTIKANMNRFTEEVGGSIHIKKHTFLSKTFFETTPSVFIIDGTSQPAYQYTFNNFQSLFQSDFSTVYQFIKGIADNLQFNFYDDPYGTIHFGVPDMTLLHLQKGDHPNNISQLLSFSETQNTENIANVQYAQAQFVYSIDMNMINTVVKDYQSIAKYGEKMMQPFSMVGLIEPTAIRYAAKMRMHKYNRKALSSIKITMQGEPQIKFDKYAYLKELYKLFYIESYSHSYNAGSGLTTSISGTYTREILAHTRYTADYSKIEDENIDKKILNSKNMYKILMDRKFDKQTDYEGIQNVLNSIQFPGDNKYLNDLIYSIYVENWNYPQDNETLKLEIGAMYTADKLRQCYLDGFFWAIPFDVNPYDIAITIQEDEFKKKKQQEKTNNVKKEYKKKQETKQIDENEVKVRELKKKILKEMTEGATPIKVDAHYKSMPNIPMEQTIYLKIKPDPDFMNRTREMVKQAMEEQKIIDNGGTILKQG